MKFQVGANKIQQSYTNGKLIKAIYDGSTKIFDAFQDYIINSSGVITSYEGYSSNVQLPKSSQITGLGSEAFLNNTDLESIYLPPTIATIGSSCFKGCTRLQDINLEDTDIHYLSDNCFQDCTDLTYITLPPLLNGIGNKALYNTRLYNVTVPSNVTTLYLDAFNGNPNLDTIYFDNPDNITNVQTNTFLGCQATCINPLASWAKVSTVFPNLTGTQLGNLFAQSHIDSVIFPATMTATTTGTYVCANCSYLETVLIYADLLTIDQGAFMNCTSLTEIDINSDVITRIGAYSFKGCTSLEELWIPSSVTNIDMEAFYNSGLRYITYEVPDGVSPTTAWNNISKGNNWENMPNGSIIKLYGYLAYYQKENGSWVYHTGEPPTLDDILGN